MYTFRSRIRYSEVDRDGKLRLSSIFDYFQDCSTFHSQDLDRGVDYLKKHGLGWVLVSWYVKVHRYPIFGEEISVRTWPYDFNGLMGGRNFSMEDENGEVLACADSLWVLMDLKRNRPIKIPEEIMETYQLFSPLPMEKASRKMKMPDHLVSYPSFPVTKFHLDTNQHVNNGKYIFMAQDFFPEGMKVKEIQVSYKKPAFDQDQIYPWLIEKEDEMVLALCDGEKNPYVIIQAK